jgi:hypothetical protein
MHTNAPLSPMKEGARVPHCYGSYAPSTYGSYGPRKANPSTAGARRGWPGRESASLDPPTHPLISAHAVLMLQFGGQPPHYYDTLDPRTPRIGLYPIVTLQYSSTTLYQAY